MMKRLFTVCFCALMWCGSCAFAQFAGEEIPAPSDKSNTSLKEVHKGYKGFVEVGGAAAVGYSAGIYTSHGYQFNPYIYTGAGIGFGAVAYTDNPLDDLILPIFAECRVNLLNPNRIKYTPYLSAQIGGSFLKDTQGIYGHLSFGYRFPLNDLFGGAAFITSLGYQITKCSRQRDWGWHYTYTPYFTHAISLRLGFEF